MAEAWREWLGAREDFRTEVAEFQELDDEHVLALVQLGGRGKTSGLELGQLRAKGAALFEIRDSKVTRVVYYWSRDRALADLGLSPDAGSSAS
jgi:ketosteroid isomerase-like protein